MGILKPQGNGPLLQEYADWNTGRWWMDCYILVQLLSARTGLGE